MKYLLTFLLLMPLSYGAITGTVQITSNEGGKSTEPATGVSVDSNDNLQVTGELTADSLTVTNSISAGTGNGQVDIGAAGVRITSDGDGAYTFLGLGDGFDEDWTFNLDDTENTVVVSSSTGLVLVDWGAIGQNFEDGTLEIPNSASDAALAAGQIHLNTTDKQLSVHNGTKEVAIPLVFTKSWSFDPDAVCDGAVDRLFLCTVASSWAPEGITITGWRVSFEADPTTEVDLDLKYADAFIGVANAAVMDVLDTTAGVSSETSAANINGGAVVAVGKVLYLEFGTAYTETTHQIIFEMDYEVEED